MASRFNWETEDESNWPESPAPQGRRFGRRAPAIVLILLMLAGVLFALYRFGQRRLEQRETAIKAEIIAAHTTWQQAVGRTDLELLSALSTREDTRWYNAQRRLLLAGEMLDRGAFGLRLESSSSHGEPEIALVPEFDAAEVRYRQAYTAEGRDTPVVLEHTAFYVRENSRWMQRAPHPGEWGPVVERGNARVLATFPERDAAFVSRLAADLNTDLGNLCEQATMRTRTASALCDPQGRIRLQFLTEPESLLALVGETRPALAGLTFQLPAPSLVGLPVNDDAYKHLYQGYTDRILLTLRQLSAQPIPLPDQDVAALCFTSEGSRLSLAHYLVAEDRWEVDTPDRAYSDLRPMPDSDGLILRTGLPGVGLDQLRLTLRQGDQEQPLLAVGQPQLTASLAGFAGSGTGEGLVLRYTRGSTGIAEYAWVPLGTCDNSGCAERDLVGFPVWSPDGESSLISDVGQLLLGDNDARPREVLGNGFSPFWLTSRLFGYVELAANRAGPDMHVVIEDAVSRERYVVADSRQLMSVVDSASTDQVRIRYATANPADPTQLLIGSSLPDQTSDGFVITSVRLEGSLDTLSELTSGEPRIVHRLPGAPVGDPGTFTPTGSPPFTISSDGRWLAVVRFANPHTNAWEISLIDLDTGLANTLNTYYPPYPAQYPFLDWSADNQWLVLVDDGFLRLIAPAYDYERVVPHEYRDCSYTGWVSR